ncbi:MAG TPA: VOC family protein [Opitutaceae bacterium]|jgi:predicted enzyme related to lactoylglutathione lyase|nr:VOC family protein [Opitutaceae bacterium]
MSTKKKTRKSIKAPASSLIWFEIPADDPKRAQKFYGTLFGWKIAPHPASSGIEYWHLDTGGHDASPDGGMMARMYPTHTITTYFNVPSVNRAVAKVKKLGGKIIRPRMPVPKMGYFAICKDTENNVFAVWEINPKAK